SLLDLSGTTHTNAGTYDDDEWSFAGNGNYNPANGTVDDKIDKASASIVVAGYDVTYDGVSHTATGSATGVGGADLGHLLDLEGTTHTKAGSWTDPWTFDGNGNYNFATGTVADEIDKANATITVTGYTGVYDGNAHGATGTAKGVNNETLSGLNLGASYTNVPGGPANWNFTDTTGNYKNANGTVPINITKANATISVSGYTGVYDGNAHGATGTATGVNGESLSGLNLGASYTNVPGGPANWNFTDATGNYRDANGTAPVNISKANATIVVNGYNVTFDGDSHTARGSATGVGGADLAALLRLGNTTHMNAGSWTDTWTFDGNNNYMAANGTVEDKITAASSEVNVDCPESRTYTGSDIEPCTATVTGAGGLNEAVTPVIYEDNENVGDATASATYGGDANHNGDTGSGGFKITAADSTTTVTCPEGPFIYNTTEHKPCSVTVTGVGGLDLMPAPTYANNTNSGIASASYTFNGDANHNGSTGSENFEIEKAATSTSVTCLESVVYSGTARTPCSARVTGPGLDEALTVAYASNTNAGTASASVAYATTGNYKASDNSKTFEITKATATISITWASSTYDATPNTATTSVSGVGIPVANLGPADSLTYYSGNTATGSPLTGAPKNIGTYTV
ncbi:MAG: hypothetical protein LC708_00390, partial [Actinobacteria bacterium]|nr:hypothetical protein [Actinomycetota bacterium]